MSWLCASDAHACSPPRCSDPVVHPDSGEVPADLFAPLLVMGFRNAPASTPPPEPHLYRVSGSSREEIAFDLAPEPKVGRGFVLRPRQVLPPGTIVVLEATSPGCTRTALSAQYTITEPRPMPSSLGTLTAARARGPLLVSVSNGSCYGDVDAVYADLQLTPASGASEVGPLLRYALLIDGKEAWRHPQTPGSPFTSAFERDARVYALCAFGKYRMITNGHVTVGAHRAKIVGTLPNGAVLASNEIALDLRCEDFPAPPAGWDDLPDWSER